MSDAELVPKYEEWITKLDGNLEALVRERANMKKAMFAAFVISPVGLFYSIWIMLLIVWLGVALYGGTVYITEMRKYQYRAELEKTRAELERLRGVSA